MELDAVWPEPPQTRVLRSLDTRWDTELERISLHDVVTMGPDRSQVSLQVRQVLRARCDGPDRRVVMHCLEDPQAGPPEIRALRGCRLGSIARDISSGILGCELVFHEPLSRGQTVVVDYEVVNGPPRPHEVRHTRRLRLPMRQYLLEVRFDPGALPAAAFRVQDGKDCQPLGLDAEHSLHVVDTDCTAGITGVRWVWPETTGAGEPPELTVNGGPTLVTQPTPGSVSAGHSLSGRITHVRTTPPPRGRTPGRDDERRPGARADVSHR